VPDLHLISMTITLVSGWGKVLGLGWGWSGGLDRVEWGGEGPGLEWDMRPVTSEGTKTVPPPTITDHPDFHGTIN
jgi:hypothetical protein